MVHRWRQSGSNQYVFAGFIAKFKKPQTGVSFIITIYTYVIIIDYKANIIFFRMRRNQAHGKRTWIYINYYGNSGAFSRLRVWENTTENMLKYLHVCKLMGLPPVLDFILTYQPPSGFAVYAYFLEVVIIW